MDRWVVRSVALVGGQMDAGGRRAYLPTNMCHKLAPPCSGRPRRLCEKMQVLLLGQ